MDFTGFELYRVTSGKQTGPYTLAVGFNNGLVRTIDFKDILHGELFGPLQDPSEFSKVYIDSEVHALTWPCGADFDSSTLHHWPEYGGVFLERAAQWSLIANYAHLAGSCIRLFLRRSGYFHAHPSKGSQTAPDQRRHIAVMFRVFPGGGVL